MRRTAIGALLALAALPLGGARADDLGTWHDITFNAPVPCSVVCPYWLDDLNNDIDGNAKEDVYFQACASPDGTSDAMAGIPGLPWAKGTVFDDVVVGPAPAGTRLLEFELTPTVDWDGFFCQWLPGDVAGEELTQPCSCLPEPCGALDGAVPIGCTERSSIETIAGRMYILRAYNWSDPLPPTARYRFLAP